MFLIPFTAATATVFRNAEMSASRNETDPLRYGIRRSTVHSYGTAPSNLLHNVNAQSGSGRNDAPPPYSVQHTIQPGDTLQGIALRYGCTTQDIRRANRLFANDNINLRASLVIPLPAVPETQEKLPPTNENQDDKAKEAWQVDYVNEFWNDAVNSRSVDQSSASGNEASSSRETKSRSDYTNLSDSLSDAQALASQVTSDPARQSNSNASNSDPQSSSNSHSSQNSATNKPEKSQFFDKYDQFLANIKPNVNRMESETERIAQMYSGSNSADAPSSTLVYLTASDVEKAKAKARANIAQAASTNGSNGKMLSRLFSSSSTQSSGANQQTVGYQSELDHEAPNAFTNSTFNDDESDFYSI